MITQTTSPPDAAEAQRRGHTAALAVGEQILMLSPVVPTTITAHCTKQAAAEPSVEVYFHQSAEGVEALAQALGTAATTKPFRPADPRPYMEMDTVVAGVPVSAWALLDIPTPVIEMPEPYACAWCGVSLPHGIQYAKAVGGHGWVQPSDVQILARMKARRAARRGGAGRG
ncbi:hypothetical protein ACH4GK_17600 [Streptomyces rimosus]|uniref:hypothetical protein n=1 Tax=Streptomyces rimosus TaxID=1927 RepID=UPI000517F6DD|nr:hypothetical protein [Streptomyces rimosus]